MNEKNILIYRIALELIKKNYSILQIDQFFDKIRQYEESEE